jgi:hypothetical protein
MRYTAPDNFVPPDDAIGVQVFAQNNLLTFGFNGKRSPGTDLVFEEAARDNTVFLYNLPNGLTNNACYPNNRVVPNWTEGFNVKTPPFPNSGEVLVNRSSFTVEALILRNGKISQWSLADVNDQAQDIPSGLFVGQSILLEPGDQVRFDYTEPPAWRWRALRS